MNAPKKNHRHGLEPSDVDLLFPDSPAGSPAPITPIDYKRRASGERPEEIENSDAEEAQIQETDEGETPKPTFEDEPWPVENPENGSLTVKQPLDNRYEPESAQAPAKITGKLMLDDLKAQEGLPPHTSRAFTAGRRLPPSDKTWTMELEKILE